MLGRKLREARFLCATHPVMASEVTEAVQGPQGAIHRGLPLAEEEWQRITGLLVYYLITLD